MSSSDPAAAAALPPEAISSRSGRLEPFEWYAVARREHPVRYDESRCSWDVFRYEDVERVLRDDAFTADLTQAGSGDGTGEGTDEAGTNTGTKAEAATDRAATDDDPAGLLTPTMLQADPPDHQRLRGFATERFRRSAVREYRPRIERQAAALLDDLEGRDRVGLVEDFAGPLPVAVVAALLDVPADRREDLGRWARELVAHAPDATEAAVEENRRRRRRARAELGEYFDGLVAERRGGGGTDLVTLAATTDALDRREAVGFCALVLVGGTVSTTSLIANAIWCLAAQDLTDAVRAGDVDRGRAIEEVLRYRSPEQAVRRVAVSETEVDGRTVEPGEFVTLWLGAANRDPDAFDAPESFRPERHPNPHLAFGSGTHYCLGADLARLVADVALEALLDRFGSIDPDVADATPLAFPYHGLESLSCAVDASE